jgi:hypothetical protein
MTSGREQGYYARSLEAADTVVARAVAERALGGESLDGILASPVCPRTTAAALGNVRVAGRNRGFPLKHHAIARHGNIESRRGALQYVGDKHMRRIPPGTAARYERQAARLEITVCLNRTVSSACSFPVR